MHAPAPRTGNYGGFTLVELLPALGRAKVAALWTKRVSNVRQLQLARQMYPGDNGGGLSSAAAYRPPPRLSVAFTDS